jgi:lipopolysaccharide biosynthesis glycosyltransferase
MTCPCVFITNEAYVPYLGVVMQSVIDNATPNNEYIFYVLYRDLREETIERFNNHIQKWANCSINFIDVSSYIEGRKFHTDGWVIEVYFKQLAPYILTDHDKLLYLDSDVVVNVDVAELFEIDMGSHILAAVRDIPMIRLFHAHFNWLGKKLCPQSLRPPDTMAELKNPDDYFNTGFLLFNAPVFRDEINFVELMDACARRYGFVDQDVLNIFCEGKTLLLPAKYNFAALCWSGTTNLPERFHAEFAEAKENPALIHLARKPWKCSFTTGYFPYFWAYAVRSPYFKEICRRFMGNGCMCDFAGEPLGIRLKHLLKEGKDGRRLALTTFMKCGFCTIHRNYLS